MRDEVCPRRMHCISKRPRRIRTRKHCGQFAVEIVEHVRQLKCMTCTEGSIQHGRLPIEAIHPNIGVVRRLSIGHAHRRHAEHAVGLRCRHNFVRRSVGAVRAVSIERSGASSLASEHCRHGHLDEFIAEHVFHCHHKHQALFHCGAGEHGHVGRRASGDCLNGTQRKHSRAKRGLERHRRCSGLAELDGVTGHLQLEGQRILRLEQLLRGELTQRVDVSRRDPNEFEKMASNGRSSGRADSVVPGAALQDGPLEQTVRGLKREQCAHAHTASRLARNRDPPWVATERSDVLLHPLQRRNLIEDAKVARVSKLGEMLAEVQEAKCAEAIVNSDAHHALAGE